MQSPSNIHIIFFQMREFTAKVINSMHVVGNGVRIAVVTFSTVVKLEFNFKEFMHSKRDMMEKILNMEYMEG